MVGYQLSKNDWVTPFFAIFRSVREILLVTVFLEHPVWSGWWFKTNIWGHRHILKTRNEKYQKYLKETAVEGGSCFWNKEKPTHFRNISIYGTGFVWWSLSLHLLLYLGTRDGSVSSASGCLWWSSLPAHYTLRLSTTSTRTSNNTS